MRNRLCTIMPERMVALSLLPPPNSCAAPAPFGYAALVITRRARSEAAFSLHAHGYGAGYDPLRMRSDIRRLFTPDTKALIYAPAPPHQHDRDLARISFPTAYLGLVPRSGLVSNIFASIPHDQLVNAAHIGGLMLSGPHPTPLQRVARIGVEAQAAWIFWLFKSCSPRLRRDLLAGHAAWRLLEQARRLRARV